LRWVTVSEPFEHLGRSQDNLVLDSGVHLQRHQAEERQCMPDSLLTFSGPLIEQAPSRRTGVGRERSALQKAGDEPAGDGRFTFCRLWDLTLFASNLCLAPSAGHSCCRVSWASLAMIQQKHTNPRNYRLSVGGNVLTRRAKWARLLHDCNRASDAAIRQRASRACTAPVRWLGTTAWPRSHHGFMGVDRLDDLGPDVAAASADQLQGRRAGCRPLHVARSFRINDFC
jgi:hypothetical protein